ncbi:MAG: Ig domain-containing protein [Armatimonadota bacterium]|nr:Ig domain-containing protein [Armatimonadota bacterium]
MEGVRMHRFYRLVQLSGMLMIVGLILTGCGATSTGNGKVSTLRVVPGQTVRAQELEDGSFVVTSQPLLATGGSPLSGYTWTLASGSAFPPGTTVTAPTGVFHGSGKGLIAGKTYSFNMQVSDGTHTATGTINLEVEPAPTDGIVPFTVFQQPMGIPVIRLPNAQANRPYGASLQVYSGVPPYSWFEDTSYAGRTAFELSGLTIDMARGVVRGTVMNSAAGKTLRFRIVVKDSTGETAATEPGRPVYEIVVE